ncbi:hypothetical protein ACFOZ7_05640 [Natribaculum luteum]|uniref:Uncharacterized protein n=1 Tax=Natribaculum luteum TaxID=1586232 RepID=A0ABD5NWP2_9EURY|nr:hypothetical protein [Natribaculum luteum]
MTLEEPDVVEEDDTEEELNDVDDRDEDLEKSEDEPSVDDVDEAVVDLTEDDLGGGLFDGVEDDDATESDESGSSDGDEGEHPDSSSDPLEVDAAAIEEAINGGAARLGVFGLSEEDLADSDMTKDQLEEELRATFEAFHLGHFGSRFVEEHVLTPADGDIDPTWGLLGTSLMAAATIIYLRPDGEEKIGDLRDAIGNLAGGLA